MSFVNFACDRCNNVYAGQAYENFTAGYYEVGPGSAWAKFAKPGEQKLCDNCMHSDPGYQAIYGVSHVG